MIPLLLLLPLAWSQSQPRIQPNYCFVTLNAVPNRPNIPPADAERIQKEHLGHLGSLHERGWLVAAGPIGTPGTIRGFGISRCKSREEAIELHSQDPAVKNGRLTIEAWSWQAPDGIGERYKKMKAADPNIKDTMVKHPMAFLTRTGQLKEWPPIALLEEHGAYVTGLMKSGQVVSAGPFREIGERAGVFIFAPMTLDEARKLAEGDPTVKAGLVRMKMLEWYTVDGAFPN